MSHATGAHVAELCARQQVGPPCLAVIEVDQTQDGTVAHEQLSGGGVVRAALRGGGEEGSWSEKRARRGGRKSQRSSRRHSLAAGLPNPPNG